jgi:hypothetical protein
MLYQLSYARPLAQSEGFKPPALRFVEILVQGAGFEPA